MTDVQWLACDLVTGRIVEELPDLKLSGTISDVLGVNTNSQFTLPIPLGGNERWLSATDPKRTMLVAVVRDRPFWAGIINRRAGGTDAELRIGTESLYSYLDARYVEDHEWTQQDDTTVIAAGLIGDADDEGIGFTVDAFASGQLRDRTYKYKDNKTIYRALTELSGVIDGPELTIDLDWEDADQLVVTKTIRIRSRLGVAASAPDAVFETTSNSVFGTLGSSEARYTYDEDYTNSKGANHIVAYSSGQGEDQPFSDPARDETLLAQGWPRYEFRFQPSSSITEKSTLDSHATARLAMMRLGGRTWTIEARWSHYPILGEHWNLGDDVAWQLLGHRHPQGITGTGRAIGWNIDPERDMVQLILWEPDGGDTVG